MRRGICFSARGGLRLLTPLLWCSLVSCGEPPPDPVPDPALQKILRSLDLTNRRLDDVITRLDRSSSEPRTSEAAPTSATPARTPVADSDGQTVMQQLAALREEVQSIRQAVTRAGHLEEGVPAIRAKNEVAIAAVHGVLDISQTIDREAWRRAASMSESYLAWSYRDVLDAYGKPDDRMKSGSAPESTTWFYNVNEQHSLCFKFQDGTVSDVFLSGPRKSKESK